MKRYKCKVIREDEYIIELDEKIYDEEWMKNFGEVFYPFETLEEHAEHIAITRARYQQQFIEGYGEIPIRYLSGYEKNGSTQGIMLKIIDEDNYWEVEVEEF